MKSPVVLLDLVRSVLLDSTTAQRQSSARLVLLALHLLTLVSYNLDEETWAILNSGSPSVVEMVVMIDKVGCFVI